MNGRSDTSAGPAPTESCTESVLRPPHPLTTRYSRQLLLPQLNGLTGQVRLAQSRVLIIGLGGLGCPAALYLAAAGVGTLGLVDGDVVEESNLHRQVLHTEDTVGLPKVESAREGLRRVNSGCRVLLWRNRVVGARDVLAVLEGRTMPDAPENAVTVTVTANGIDKEAEDKRIDWDLVLDCTDNPATRYAINDAAVLAGIPIVSGAAQRGEGMLMVLNFRWQEQRQQDIGTTNNSTTNTSGSISTDQQPPIARSPLLAPKQGRGPCYRCIFPHPPDPSTVHSCSEIGVLCTAVGTIGLLMAQEALKLLVQDRGVAVLTPDDETGKRGQMLIFNAFSAQGLKGMWRGVGLRGRRDKCVSCGEGENRITRQQVEEGTMDYEAFCGRVEDVKVLDKEKGERVAAEAFLDVLLTATRWQHRKSGEQQQQQHQQQGQKIVERERRSRVRVVDVREEIEVELGSTLDGAIHVPFSKIMRDPDGAFGAVEWTDIHSGGVPPDHHELEKVYFVCHRGNDSQIAAKKLMELDEKLGRKRAWIGDVEGGFVAMERAAHQHGDGN